MERLRLWLGFGLSVLLCALVLPASAQDAPAPSSPDRADSPEGRIKAAPLPAPGKECATDELAAEAEAKLPEQKLLRSFQEAAMQTIQTAEEIADEFDAEPLVLPADPDLFGTPAEATPAPAPTEP